MQYVFFFIYSWVLSLVKGYPFEKCLKCTSLTPPNVKGLLIEEYKKREKKEDNNSIHRNEALLSDKSNFASSRGRNSRRGGQKFGRTESFRQRDRQGPNQGLKCYKCPQIGHFVKNCPLNRIAEHDCKQQDDSIALNSSTTCRNRVIRWYIDSGATKHMTFEKDLIVDFYEYEQPSKIYLGGNRAIEAFGEGKVNLSCYDESHAVALTLNKVLYVPNLSKNLLSVPAMTQMGADVLFDEGKCIISKNERKFTTGHLLDSKLYIVNRDGEAHIASTTSQSLEQWYCRFGHFNYSYIDRLIKGKLVEGMSCSSE